MFEYLRIKNLRLFDDIQIKGLRRINLLGGRNNSGKTTVLEALFLLSGRGNPELVVRINTFRGVTEVKGSPAVVPETYWKPLFSDLDMHQRIEISGKYTRKGVLVLAISTERGDVIELPGLHADGELSEPWALRLSYGRGGKVRAEGRLRMTRDGLQLETPTTAVPFGAVFVSSRSGSLREDAVRLGRLRARKQGNLLTKVLQIVEPRLRSVEDLSASGVPMIWGDIGLSELAPLAAMGEGMTRVARIVLAISNVPGGIVLVDEVENGIHHSIMNKVWAVVADAARQFDTQIFATTHSFECFRAAHDALSTDEWRYHRLDRTEDGPSHCVTFETEDVEAAVRHDLEVR